MSNTDRLTTSRDERIPHHQVRELAVKSSTDPRTILSVFRDPASADRNSARARAANVLREAGLIAANRAA